MADERVYRLRVGEVVIGCTCPDAPFAANMAQYFDQPSDPAEADIQLELILVPQAGKPAIPNSLILHKTVRDGAFDIANGLISGHFDPATGTGELRVNALLTQGRLTRVFEQIFYQAFHSACRRAGYEACLVHSAGVVAAGRGYVFVGPSEAGKTTIARLSGEHTVLNDEMSLVEFHREGLRLVNTPFNGHFRAKTVGSAPLDAVLLLDKGRRHALASVGRGEAAAAIATQVAPPVGLDETADHQTPQIMLDLGTRIAMATEVRRLRFEPDAGFWPLIREQLGSVPRG